MVRVRWVHLPLLIASLLQFGGCDDAPHSTVPTTNAPTKTEPKQEESTTARAAMLRDDSSTKRQLTAELILEPKELVPGEKATLVVKLNIQPGWHIAPMVPVTGPVRATQFKLDLPAGVQTVGDWKKPQPSTSFDGRANRPIYDGQVEFSRELAVEPGRSAGPAEIVCHASYQLCNETLCQAPKDLELRTILSVKK